MYHHNGSNWHCMTPNGPNGPKTLPMGTLHDIISCHVMFWGPRRSSEGPGGPDLVPTAHDWPVWVGVMLTTHFDLVSSPFWAPRGPKRDRFGPKCPFWGPRRSSEGPGGPNLIPTAPDWSAWAGLMLTTHFDLVSGPFWVPRRTTT